MIPGLQKWPKIFISSEVVRITEKIHLVILKTYFSHSLKNARKHSCYPLENISIGIIV